MDAPSQNMNALSVQSLYYVSDEALHEIDLRLLCKLPETLRLLQEQVQLLSGASLVPHALAPHALAPLELEAEVSERPSFSRRAPTAVSAVVG